MAIDFDKELEHTKASILELMKLCVTLPADDTIVLSARSVISCTEAFLRICGARPPSGPRGPETSRPTSGPRGFPLVTPTKKDP